MNDDIIRRFAEHTRDASEIYLLGDIFGSCQPEFPRDACISVMKKMGVHERPFHLVLGNHDNLNEAEYLEAGFTSVRTLDFIEIGGFNFMLTHDPCMVQPKDTLAICGHIHTLFAENWQPSRNTFTINVSLDVRDYSPVSEREILDLVARSNYRR
jgi:calcineurin-like phosphoesterase family protein